MGFRRGLAWTVAGQAAFFIIQFVGSVIVARLLSPYDLGVYALAMAITGALNLIQSIGLGSYLVRQKDLTTDRVATAFTVNLIISVSLSAATATLALGGSWLFQSRAVGGVLLILALTPLIGIVSIVPYAMLEREANFKLISVSGVIRNLIATGGTVALAAMGWSYYAIAYSQVLASLTQAVVLCVVARRHVNWRISLKDWREVASFGSQMIAITGVNNLAARTSDFLLGRVTGLVALGLFNRASNVVSLLWDNIHVVMGRVAFAEMARQKRESRSLRPFYLNVVAMTTAFLWPLFTGLSVLAFPLIRLVYGPKWIEAAAPFAILNVSAVVLSSVTMTWEVFVACGETGRQARFEFIRTGLGTIAFAIGCTISLEAAAFARVLESVFSVILYRPHVERMTDTGIRDTGPIYIRSALLTLVAVGPAIVLISSVPGAAITVMQIMAVVILGVILWLAGLITIKHPIYREGMSLLKVWQLSRATGASKQTG